MKTLVRSAKAAWPDSLPLRIILLIAILLRAVGVLVNTEANDNHVAVASVMAFEHRIPQDSELWEAFQPKLYHATVALVFMAAVPLVPDLDRGYRVRIGQAVSGAAGVLTLFILLSFLQGLPLPSRALQLTFALVALNPQLFATSIQATNDAFGILFASIALVTGYRFFQTFRWQSFAVMAAAIALACLAKGNGLAAGIAVACAFLAALVHPSIPRRRLLGFVAVFLTVFAVLVPPLGGYLSRYLEGRSPFATNLERPAKLHFLEKNYDSEIRAEKIPAILVRRGIASVADGFLTFRLADMLRDPKITNDADPYPRHRTSFWSLLYGYAHSVHYPYWPPTWQTRNPAVLWLTRAILVLALVPTTLLAVGILRAIARTIAGTFRREPPAGWNAELLLATSGAGYIAFLMLYAYMYIDFGTMKALFIYPALPAYAVFLAREFARLDAGRSRPLRAIAFGGATALCVAYVADVTVLLLRLTTQLAD
jgi:hypothetical protein